MIENSLSEYLNNKINRLASEAIKKDRQELQDIYFGKYITNYTNGIADLEKMFASPNTTDPFMKVRILGAIKQQKKELMQITREYNQIKRQRQQRQQKQK